MTEYKDIEEFPGYKIGNDGTIISNRKIKGIIKTFPNPEGYYFAYLYRNKIRHAVAVHRLVAKYFVNNPNEFDCVNHIDENKGNNIYTNLEWCSRSYNRKYGTCENRRAIALSSKFGITQYDLDGNFIRNWNNCREAARTLGFKSSAAIQQCVNGINNTSYGYIWRKSNSN